MRSDLIFGATLHVSNRYLFVKLAAKAVRELHKPGVRVEDTANDVFRHFSRANAIGEIRTTLEPSGARPLRTRPFSAIPSYPQVFMLVPASEDSDSLWEEELVLFA
ncbi:hypothetical protein [Acidicapsa acidisoli]|uniref:hypothetical protein n=1 Tax=Acidicapsa acidisoli TaxID=1615681 RepID=UPI0021DF469A|nr:hypothetical protein [Acidicapsa acidisoli]